MITRRVRHLQARAFLPGRDLERPPSKITFIHASPMLQLLRLSHWGWSLNRDYDAAKAKRYNHAVGAVAAHSDVGLFRATALRHSTDKCTQIHSFGEAGRC